MNFIVLYFIQYEIFLKKKIEEKNLNTSKLVSIHSLSRDLEKREEFARSRDGRKVKVARILFKELFKDRLLIGSRQSRSRTKPSLKVWNMKWSLTEFFCGKYDFDKYFTVFFYIL